MRQERQLEFVAECPKEKIFFSKADLSVEIHSRFCRKSSEALDSKIDALWEQKKAILPPNAKLFNALKFRLHDCRVLDQPQQEQNASASSASSSPRLLLQLGISDYKSHVGTNVAPATMQIPGRQQEANDDDDANKGSAPVSDVKPDMAHCLGVESVVVTSDKKLLLFSRSNMCADFAGYLCVPGGHAEPCRVLKQLITQSPQLFPPPSAFAPFAAARLDERIPAAAVNAACIEMCNWVNMSHEREQTTTQLIVDEIFHSIADEIASELGLEERRGSVDVVGIVAVMRATAEDQRGKPDVLFVAHLTDLTTQDVRQLFAKRSGEDAFEADDAVGLVAVPVLDAANDTTLFAKHKVTPASTAAILAAKQWLLSL